jgi:DNA-binding MarR family transcriptional regulator
MPKATQPSIAYLIHRIAVRIEDSINAKARKYRLRVGEIRVLMRILDHGDLSVGQLSEMTSIQASALSHLLRRLDEEGWISRTRSSRDNRLVLVRLTEHGKKFAAMLQPYVREYNQAAEKGIKTDELEILYAQLETIYANIVRLEGSLHDFPGFDLDNRTPSRPTRRSRGTNAARKNEPALID